MQRDSIDFGSMKISELFARMFVPTLLGFVSMACINIADGIFVGKGVGSDALASVNIVAPLYLISSGIGLMFGAGASIVAAIHLAQNNEKAARINVTQAYCFSTIVMTLLALMIMIFPVATMQLLGGTDILKPYIIDYMRYIVPSLPFIVIYCVGMFVIRLDGSPTYAMLVELIPAAINIVLDYLFVFPFGMGITGAALATAIAQVLGALMVVVYMVCSPKQLRLYKLKFTETAIKLFWRNIGYMSKMGSSSMIGELAISCIILVGNLCFIPVLGEDGVAAYSVVCYCFPIIFMIGNSIAQSAQPILSYNYGAGNWQRVQATLKLCVRLAVTLGIVLILAGILGSKYVVAVFLDSSTHAYELCSEGFPLFSFGFFCITLNLVLIGYYQSMEQIRKSNIFMLLRGFLLVIPIYVVLPHCIGAIGLWLSVPVAEFLTTMVILFYVVKDRVSVGKE